MESYKEIYELWCSTPYIDAATKEELEKIRSEEEIKDRFYKNLAFGTGGLRGVLGVGTNRMNRYTVWKATQGLADYIKEEKGEKKGVAIAFDSRHMSEEFSELAALCLNANGIQTYRFESLRPTPELSFTIRKLGCFAGIVITASHNPPEYNGYKVYGEDGSQITDKAAAAILEKINSINDFGMMRKIGKEAAKEQGLYHIVGDEIDDAYIKELKKLILSPGAIERQADNLKIVYTPLHGTGNIPVRRVLQELGFKNVYVVAEQEKPDGDFPTVSYPNPEDPDAFKLALELAEKVDADIVLATDPDADRLGVYAKDEKTGEYHSFTGNMSGLLIAEYELSRKKEMGLLPEKPENGALVKTIVSSDMADEIAAEYGISLIEVLTGFKYIGEQIKFFEQAKAENNNKLDASKGAYEYLFGFEESYGCLVGTHARDKDACAAVMALCEAAAYYKDQGKTLWDQMICIYDKYGYYKEQLYTVTLKGLDGTEQIQKILADLRENLPERIGAYEVVRVRDYKTKKIYDLKENKITGMTLPVSNVLYFELTEHAWACVRPSGTEPKVKLYMGIKGKNEEDAQSRIDSLKESLVEMVLE